MTIKNDPPTGVGVCTFEATPPPASINKMKLTITKYVYLNGFHPSQCECDEIH